MVLGSFVFFFNYMYLETISENKRIKLRYFKILIKNENGRIVFFPQIHYDIVI